MAFNSKIFVIFFIGKRRVPFVRDYTVIFPFSFMNRIMSEGAKCEYNIDKFLWKHPFTLLRWLGSFLYNVCGVDVNVQKTSVVTHGKLFHSELTVVTKEYRTFKRHLTQLTTNPCHHDTRMHTRRVYAHSVQTSWTKYFLHRHFIL